MPKSGVVESVLSEDSKHFGPIITKFKHGSLVSPENLKDVELVVGRSEGERTFNLFAKTDKLTYTNDVPSVLCSKVVPSRKVYLAILNKTTRRVRLVESSIQSLGPQITARRANNDLLTEEPSTTDADSWLTARKELVNRFGQAKGKRIMAQANKMMVDEEAYVHKMTDAVSGVNVEGMLVKKEEQGVPAEGLIPPINRAAKSPGQVYELSRIIPPHLLKELEEASKEFLNNYSDDRSISAGMESKEISSLMGFLLRKNGRFYANPQIPGAILFLEGLLIFSELKDSRFQHGSHSCLPSFLPGSVRRYIYSNFSDEGKLTPMARDKALCHAIVLTLLSGSYKFDFKSLLTSVRVPANKLRLLISSTGACVLTDKVTNISEVILKIPLATFDFNKVTRKRKK